MKIRRVSNKCKLAIIVFVFIASLALQGCSSKKDALTGTYVGTYKDLVQGGQINVGSQKACIK